MKQQIVLFGIQAELNVVNLGCGLGISKELVFTCSKDVADKIITESVKRGYPFERTKNGVTIYN